MNKTNQTLLVEENNLNQWLPYQIVLATIAFVSNLILMVVFWSDRHLLKHLALIFGYICSNVTVLIACAFSVTYQLILYFRNEGSSQVNIIISCLCTFAPQILWFSFAAKALFLIVLGLERVIAVASPIWYHKKWSVKTRWKLCGVVFGCALVSVGATWIDMAVRQGFVDVSKNSCAAQSISSNTAFIYSLFLKIVGGTVCIITTVVSLVVGKVKMQKLNKTTSEMANRVQNQMAFVKSMFILATLDILLVVIPNLLIFLDFTKNINLPTYVSVAGPLACCVNVAVSAWTFLVFNKKIRSSFMKLIKRVKSANNTVVPINITIPLNNL